MMQDSQTLAEQIDTLKTLLADRLGLTRGPLARRIGRAGRRLPVAVRRDLKLIADAEAMAQNPRLALRLNPMDTHAAFVRARTFLAGIDVKDRRKGIVLGLLGSLAFNLLAVAVLLLLVLRWRGFV